MIARSLYRISTVLAAPFIAHYMKRRLAEGKEDPQRFCERHGKPTLPRPDGPLVWIHAASNGEAMSALPLIDLLLARDPAGHVLLTTGTVTSARLMADKLPPRALHQFVPVDRSAWVDSFLTHWRPDAGIWVESEFWPALIWGMRAAGKPVALVNGRVSKRSLAGGGGGGGRGG
ncbi:MAG: glycosyltransferase N-terminal domain-containing protein, partial [Alphaproteobacteria bacterium]|nr:glycosyltransferase N-terminal domain-containing protein [Alphaproteobacteria bacterium]